MNNLAKTYPASDAQQGSHSNYTVSEDEKIFVLNKTFSDNVLDEITKHHLEEEKQKQEEQRQAELKLAQKTYDEKLKEFKKQILHHQTGYEQRAVLMGEVFSFLQTTPVKTPEEKAATLKEWYAAYIL